jgi:hypothetical protein
MQPERSRDTDYTPWLVGGAVLIFAILVVVKLFGSSKEEPPAVPEPEKPAPVVQKAPEPVVEVPAPAPEPEPTAPLPDPLPALDESDKAIGDALTGLLGEAAFKLHVVPDGLIRRIVATVDNLPNEKLALRLWPVTQTPGKFMVEPKEMRFTLKPENYARYKPFVGVATAVDTGKLAAIYFRFYPLFQRAYEDLGYPKRHFNDRLVAVIDHLLAAPEVPGTIVLVQPAVYYKYADAKLEKLSAGQKALIRVGPENAALLKKKLREIRAAVAGRKP